MLATHADRVLRSLRRALTNVAGDEDADAFEKLKTAVDRVTLEDEDVLTTMVFGRLRYLPDAVAWDLVVGTADALLGQKPDRPARLDAELWPFLDAADGDRSVEPDVVWRGDGVTVGVEVKWNDRQKSKQLDDEHAALTKAYPDDTVVMVALGNVGRERRDELATTCATPHLLALDWERMCRRLVELARDSSLREHERRVLLDLRAMLTARRPLWGREPKTMDSLPTPRLDEQLFAGLRLPRAALGSVPAADPRAAVLPPWSSR